jgi:hypothetical protein
MPVECNEARLTMIAGLHFITQLLTLVKHQVPSPTLLCRFLLRLRMAVFLMTLDTSSHVPYNISSL